MTSFFLSWPPLPIPITTQSRQQSQPDTNNSHRYRRNLATAAIASYLKMIAVPHRVETSSSGLTLYIEELDGYVACCSVVPGESKCEILEQERINRKGFLFVELADPYYQAHILGFVREVTVRELPLSYLQPLSAFTAALAEHSKSSQSSRPTISLSEWIAGRIPGWLSPQNPSFPEKSPQAWAQFRDIPNPQPSLAMRGTVQPNKNPLYKRYASDQGDNSLARSLSNMEPIAALTTIIEHSTSDTIRWQAAEQLAYTDSNHPLAPSIRVKSLADDLAGLAVTLLVGIITKPNGAFLIGCRLYATDEQSSLPTDIVLQGVEEDLEENTADAGTAAVLQVFCEITPTIHGDPLEYLFTAEKGDRFSFQIRHQGHLSTSTFILPAVQNPSEPVP